MLLVSCVTSDKLPLSEPHFFICEESGLDFIIFKVSLRSNNVVMLWFFTDITGFSEILIKELGIVHWLHDSGIHLKETK